MVTCPLRDAETGSLLHWAASDGEELVLDLLRHHIPGIDFNLVNEQGYTPLHLAVLNDRAGIIERLVASPGIDVNARDIHGHTPLSLAAMRCSASSVAELLKASDINVNERAPGGFGNDGCFWTPLQWAATQGADLRSSENGSGPGYGLWLS